MQAAEPCPSFNRGCYGCYGPMESPNASSLDDLVRKLEMDDVDLVRVYRTFNAGAPAFRRESERHDSHA